MDAPPYYSSGYTLELYCDHKNADHGRFPHCFYGETFGECAKRARALGWTIHRNYTATCPKCSAQPK
jgi:hypothetical protein